MTAVGRVAVIGEETAVAGYVLAGAVVVPAEDAHAVREAWHGLAADVEVVLLTSSASRVLGPECAEANFPLTVVMPS